MPVIDPHHPLACMCLACTTPRPVGRRDVSALARFLASEPPLYEECLASGEPEAPKSPSWHVEMGADGKWKLIDPARDAAADYRRQASDAISLFKDAQRVTTEQAAELASLKEKNARLVRQVGIAAKRVSDMEAMIRPGVSIAEGTGYDCHLIWWPDELKIPYADGQQGQRTIAPWSVKLTPVVVEPPPKPFPRVATLNAHAQSTGIRTPENLR
jgi:hypothetical protein